MAFGISWDYRTMAAVLLMAAFWLLAGTPQAEAQVRYGSIVGTVTDLSGATVPGATVSILDVGTQQSLQALTDTGGAFSFPTVEAGTYDVSVTKEGFEKFLSKGISLEVNQVARVDASLHPGAIKQTVEVTSQAPALQTDSAQVRNVISSEALVDLPMSIDSSFESLLVLIPGVTSPTNLGSFAANPTRGLVFYTNGMSAQANVIRVDGVSVMGVWGPYYEGYTPSREAIQTISAVTDSSEVSQGVVGAGAFNVAIKSGTNQVHGSAYWYNMNNGVEAGAFNFVPPPPGQRIAKMIDNDFGGTIGGRIIKNKLFYFGSFESYYYRLHAQGLYTVPSAAMRQGDFTAADNPAVTYTTIYNPFTGNADGTGRTAFANNTIPSTLISSISAKILTDIVPLPNEAGATSNYFAAGSLKTDHYTTDTRLDWNVSDKLRASGRLGWLKYTGDSPAAFGSSGPVLSSYGGRFGVGGGNVYNVTGSVSYVPRPNFVVNGYFGMLISDTDSVPFDENTNEGLVTLGIPGTNGPNTYYGGWPEFSLANYSLFGAGTPLIFDDNSYIYSADASWVKGSHTVGFGGSITRDSMNHFEADEGPGQFFFGVGQTALNTGGGKSSSTNQFNDMAAFLLGVTSSETKDILPFDNGRLTAHWMQYSAYVQDRWQVRHNLTLNGGLSWNYFPFGARDQYGMERYIWSTNQVEICGAGGNPLNCGYDIPWADFSPSAGVAYRPTSTLVLRVGAGLTYDPEPLAFMRDSMSVYPMDEALTVSSPNTFAYQNTLAAGFPAITYPSLSSGFIPLPPGFQSSALTQHVSRDYMESWNFTVQKQLKGGWVAQAGYVATRQVKVPGQLFVNEGQIGGGTASEPYNILYGTTGNLYLITPVNHSKYDSLQAQVSHTYANNYTLTAAYTWSKTLGFCCNNFADGGPSIVLPQYFYLNYALEPWDTPQKLTISGEAKSPFGRGQRWLNSGGVAPKLAGGWELSVMFQGQSGMPFTVSSSGTSLNAPGSSQQADLVGSGKVAIFGKTGPGQDWFDTTRFAPVTAVRFGTSGLDNVFGPGLANVALGIFRDFKLNERWTLQFRANAFNLTNSPNFAAPNASVNSGSFGQISSLSPIGGTEGQDQRILQFGVHLTF
jgi:hypothetical protein